MEYFIMVLITILLGVFAYKERERIKRWVNSPSEPKCSDKTEKEYDVLKLYGIEDAADVITTARIRRARDLKRIAHDIDEALRENQGGDEK